MPSLQFSQWARSREFSIFSGVLGAAAWVFFSIAHIARFKQTGDVSLVLIVAAETLVAALFLLRTSPQSVSMNPLDWFVAIAGTFVPMLFRPSDAGVLPEARYVMFVGLVLQIMSLVSLSRSLAVVAAHRTIKTGKMYRFVRHPLYASYCVVFTSYVLMHTSPANLGIYAAFLVLMLWRIFQEERHLSASPTYRDYMQQVRYRLVPFVF